MNILPIYQLFLSEPILIILPLLHIILLLRFRDDIFFKQPIIAYYSNLLYVWALVISFFYAVFHAIDSSGTRGVWNFQIFSYAFADGGPLIVAWAYLGFIFCGFTVILHLITLKKGDLKLIKS